MGLMRHGAATCFRVNQTHVAHETFDGETLAINLDTGTYYSLPGISGQIWVWLLEGASLETISQALFDLYEGERAIIETEAEHFIETLRAENLISSDKLSAISAPVVLAKNEADKRPFVTPTIEIHSDLQDLLLLDPIHDTDAAGWPVGKS
jgi:coenzyme PQQ synthesis protein D (PqqD)